MASAGNDAPSRGWVVLAFGATLGDIRHWESVVHIPSTTAASLASLLLLSTEPPEICVNMSRKSLASKIARNMCEARS
jgi:hypothetical protein